MVYLISVASTIALAIYAAFLALHDGQWVIALIVAVLALASWLIRSPV